VSASHNPFDDNGLKLFGADGAKLADAEEAALEAA
jgi:phosphoglucosamine mutase